MAKNGSAEETDRTGMVARDMSDAELKAASEELAHEIKLHEALEEKKRSHNRKWNEQLAQHQERIGELATEIESGRRWVDAQLQFADVPRAQAAAAKSAGKSKGRRAKVEPEAADAE